MEYVVGILGAVALAVFAKGFRVLTGTGPFAHSVLIVIAFLYVLFRAIDGRTSVLLVEGTSALVFSGIAMLGFRNGCRIVGIGIAAHGVFDLLHYHFVEDAGVPVWWPGFCGSIDILLGAYVVAFCGRTMNVNEA